MSRDASLLFPRNPWAISGRGDPRGPNPTSDVRGGRFREKFTIRPVVFHPENGLQLFLLISRAISVLITGSATLIDCLRRTLLGGGAHGRR